MTTPLSGADALAGTDAFGAVLNLVQGLVGSERECAAQLAAIMLQTHCTGPLLPETDSFFLSGAHMLAAKLEVEKWSPLLTAMQRYKAVGIVGAHEEKELVWLPVYHALRSYIVARERSLYAQAGARPPVLTPSSTPAPSHSARDDTGNSAPASSVRSNVLSGGVARADAGLRSTAVTHNNGRAETVQHGAGASGGHGDGHRSRTPPPSLESSTVAYDRNLLAGTVQCFRKASSDLDNFCCALVAAIGENQFTPEEREDVLRSVTCGTRVSTALERSSVEIEVQMAELDTSGEGGEVKRER